MISSFDKQNQPMLVNIMLSCLMCNVSRFKTLLFVMPNWVNYLCAFILIPKAYIMGFQVFYLYLNLNMCSRMRWHFRPVYVSKCAMFFILLYLMIANNQSCYLANFISIFISIVSQFIS